MFSTNVNLLASTWSQVILAVAAVFSGSAVFIRWMNKNVAKPLKAVPEIQQNQERTHKQLTSLTTEVANIKKEVQPNGGTSLRDSVIRQEKVNAETAASVVDINEKLELHLEQAEQTRTEIVNALSEVKQNQK